MSQAAPGNYERKLPLLACIGPVAAREPAIEATAPIVAEEYTVSGLVKAHGIGLLSKTMNDRGGPMFKRYAWLARTPEPSGAW